MIDLLNSSVMIVDDEPDNIGVVALVFQFNHITVRGATSGLECLKLLEEEAPSLFLIDIQMPEMSGYELLQRIRENPAWNHIPIIALTAHARPEDRKHIMEAGFTGYISKPVTVTTFMDELNSILMKVM